MCSSDLQQLSQQSASVRKDEQRVPLPPQKPSPGIRPAQPGDQKSTVNKDEDESMDKAHSRAGQYVMGQYSGGVGGTQKPVSDVKTMAHVHREGGPKLNRRSDDGATMATRREHKQEANALAAKYPKQVRSWYPKEAKKAEDDLHKAMCPVMKGLAKLLKGIGGDIDKGFTDRVTNQHRKNKVVSQETNKLKKYPEVRGAMENLRNEHKIRTQGMREADRKHAES